MPPQPFPTLYINSCSLSLHPPRIHKADTPKKKSYHCAQAGSQFVKRCKCFSILLNYWNKPKIDVKRLEGDVTEKDNVLLSLCCSKNSMTNRTRRKEGFFYLQKHLSDWLSSWLHTVVLPPLLSWSETWGWRMRLGWAWGGGGGVKVSLPDKTTASEIRTKDWEGSLGNLTGPSLLSLDQ